MGGSTSLALKLLGAGFCWVTHHRVRVCFSNSCLQILVLRNIGVLIATSHISRARAKDCRWLLQSMVIQSTSQL